MIDMSIIEFEDRLYKFTCPKCGCQYCMNAKDEEVGDVICCSHCYESLGIPQAGIKDGWLEEIDKNHE